jgi:hypothetical protein
MIKYTLLIVAMFFGIAILAQKTELPMKNDMIYYSTEDIKMTNTKKCLSTYIRSLSVLTEKCMTSLSSEIRKNSRNKAKYTTPEAPLVGVLAMPGFSQNAPCKDTLNGEFIITLPGNISPFLFGNVFKKKNIAVVQITAVVQVIFTSKDTYKMKMKGFIYKAGVMENYEVVWEDHPLEELYLAYTNAEKISKDETYMYEDLNVAVLGFQRILNEYLKSAYKADELD